MSDPEFYEVTLEVDPESAYEAGSRRDLDRYRPGWELVDWPGYRLFGIGRSAGMQFSRGCPLTCTYCGQWLFWKKWRHRSPRNFVGAYCTNIDIRCLPGGTTVGSTALGMVHSRIGA